jgi:hypothetical protein
MQEPKFLIVQMARLEVNVPKILQINRTLHIITPEITDFNHAQQETWYNAMSRESERQCFYYVVI